MNTFEKLAKKQRELTEQIRKDGKEALAEYLKEAFDADANLLAVGWVAYTPGFNDGEPCTYTLGDLNFRYKGFTPSYSEFGDDDEYDEEGGDTEGKEGGWAETSQFYHGVVWSHSKPMPEDGTIVEKVARYDGNRWRILTGVHPFYVTAARMNNDFQDNEAILETSLGNDVKVIATRKGIKVTEYSCGF